MATSIAAFQALPPPRWWEFVLILGAGAAFLAAAVAMANYLTKGPPL